MDKQERGICHPGHACKVALEVKNLPANSGDVRDTGSMPGWGSCPGGGNGTPLQHSCLENPTDREACWATVHGATKSWTQLRVTTHTALAHPFPQGLGAHEIHSHEGSCSCLTDLRLRCMKASDCPKYMKSEYLDSNSKVLMQNPAGFPSAVFSSEPPHCKPSISKFLKSFHFAK